MKAVVGFYGVYDMLAQCKHDLLSRPLDNISEKYLGAGPHTNRRIIPEASPMNYATMTAINAKFLLIHGTDDDVVDPPSQSVAFLNALNQAELDWSAAIIIPGAGTFLGDRSVRRRSELQRRRPPRRACCGFWRRRSEYLP